MSMNWSMSGKAQKMIQDLATQAWASRRDMLDFMGAAFVQATGLDPLECELVEERTPDSIRWYFRKRPELRTREEAMARESRGKEQAAAESAPKSQPVLGPCIHCTVMVRHNPDGDWMGVTADGRQGPLHAECRKAFDLQQGELRRAQRVRGEPHAIGIVLPQAKGSFDHRQYAKARLKMDVGTPQTQVSVTKCDTNAPSASFTCERCKLLTAGEPSLVDAGGKHVCGPCADEVDPSRKGPTLQPHE